MFVCCVTHFCPAVEMYELTESHLDLWILIWPILSGRSPRSSAVLQSAEPLSAFHLQSVSVKYPRKTGDAAVSASIIGHNGVN